MWFTCLTQPVFSQCKERAGLEYPKGFREKSVAVRHIHCDVLRITAIKLLIIEWEVLAVTMEKLNIVLHSYKRGQLVAGLNEGPCYVDAIHVTAEPLGQVAGGAADAAADINKAVPFLDRQLFGKIDCRREAPCMEMIDRREVFDSRGPGIDPGIFHGFQDSCKYIALAPMVGNRLSVCHVWPSSFTATGYHSVLTFSRWLFQSPLGARSRSAGIVAAIAPG